MATDHHVFRANEHILHLTEYVHSITTEGDVLIPEILYFN